MNHLVAPSILAADFANLRDEIEMVNISCADWFHLDIMDGVFVPNISFGMPVIKAIAKYAKKPLDVHLMIVNPDKYLKTFKDAGAEVLTVHYEACKHLHRTVQEIKALGMQAGVAINPHTSVEALEEIIADVDLVCVMSVNPGFGGQKFIENTYSKIRKLLALINEKESPAKIEVDGGVDMENAPSILSAAAGSGNSSGQIVLVAGNTVFGAKNPAKTIEQLKNGIMHTNYKT